MLTNDPARSFTGVGWSPEGQKVAFACGPGGNHDTELCVADPDGRDLTFPVVWYLDIDDAAWSPDGKTIAFAAEDTHCPQNECEIDFDLAKVNVDGTGFTKLTNYEYAYETEPNWFSDGSKIAFTYAGVSTIRPDGTGYAPLASGASPNGSPDGSTIAYSRFTGTNQEIYVAGADGTGEVQLTSNTVNDIDPAWSPDGQKITFASDEGGDYEIFVMNRDGTGRQALTANSVIDRAPDWQPIPINGYARPKGATPFQTFFTVAYQPCPSGSGNRQHGPPLAVGSCSPAAQSSNYLTVGTLDSNGLPAKLVGAVWAGVTPGNPSTPADEADVKLNVSIKDVRMKSDLSDYAGELSVQTLRRITDKDNTPNPGGPGAATTNDLPFAATVPCAPTADTTIGSFCSVMTTADTLVPGQVKEEKRSIWQLGQVRVYDGGSDGDADTPADNTLFLDEGVFVP